MSMNSIELSGRMASAAVRQATAASSPVDQARHYLCRQLSWSERCNLEARQIALQVRGARQNVGLNRLGDLSATAAARSRG